MYGGVPLALKNGSYAGVGSVDVLAVLLAFEEINSCRITVQLSTQSTPKLAVMQVTMSAHSKPENGVEPAVLASRQLTVGFSGRQTIDQCILQGLYGLDADLADKEFAKTHNK